MDCVFLAASCASCSIVLVPLLVLGLTKFGSSDEDDDEDEDKDNDDEDEHGLTGGPRRLPLPQCAAVPQVAKPQHRL